MPVHYTVLRRGASSDSTRLGPLDFGPQSTFAQTLWGLRPAWRRYRRTRDRAAVYDFLEGIFQAANKWQLFAVPRNPYSAAAAYQAIAYQADPMGGLMLCASGGELGRRTASKWSRELRYARKWEPSFASIEAFIRTFGRDFGFLERNASRRKWDQPARRPKADRPFANAVGVGPPRLHVHIVTSCR
jgi:hypothetical protein